MTDAPHSQAGASAPDNLVELGRIVSAYGLRGWVKIQPHSVRSEALLTAKRWWLVPSSRTSGPVLQEARPWKVKLSRTQGSTIVGALEGIADRNDAEALKGMLVMVARSDFPETDEGEYYWVDLMGCRVWGLDDAGAQAVMGVVADVSDNGAHAVLSVRRQQEQDGLWVDLLDDKERPLTSLVPFVDVHLQEVDLPGRRIVTNWPLDF
ncbi:ribosome maturation factor RimM [Kerstersia sp.]|uniref:ribosome maturation factor RimM n=1 Tax=Kerstersia sp. TaxID=1930783 RepID=UPI003F9277A7